MSRFGGRRRRRRHAWKTTAGRAAQQTLATTTADPPVAVPDGNKDLSGGVLIETSVLARLLGVKLLTLEGTVIVSPADIRPLDIHPQPRYESAVGSTPRDALQPASPNSHPNARGKLGNRLEATQELIEANTKSLRALGASPSRSRP